VETSEGACQCFISAAAAQTTQSPYFLRENAPSLGIYVFDLSKYKDKFAEGQKMDKKVRKGQIKCK
jgi:hypothetical protein